jgi:ABC-type transport system involved in multi-copper enzyme maturation permease subunit
MFRKHLPILIQRERLRLLKNPLALSLLGLLAAVSLLIATSRPPEPPRPQCWIVYWHESPWIDYLREQIAAEAGVPIHIRRVDEMRLVDGRVAYPMGDLAIEIEPPRVRPPRPPAMANAAPVAEEAAHENENEHEDVAPSLEDAAEVAQDAPPDMDTADESPPEAKPDEPHELLIVYRYSGKDPNVIRPYQQWFWHKSVEHLGATRQIISTTLPIRAQNAADLVEMMNQTSIKDLITTEIMAALMVFTIQFFACCYLLVSFTSQDRERGTLLALALTPATPREILLAKFAFHLAISLLMTGVVLAILVPAALLRPWMWAVAAANSVGLMSVGTMLTALTRSQTTASLLTLCYMLSLGVVFYLSTKFSAFLLIQRLMFERYGFPLLLISIRTDMPLGTAAGFWWLLVLVSLWFTLAMFVFHRRGWR